MRKRLLKYVMSAEASTLNQHPKSWRFVLNAHTFYIDMKIAIISSKTADAHFVFGMEAEATI